MVRFPRKITKQLPKCIRQDLGLADAVSFPGCMSHLHLLGPGLLPQSGPDGVQPAVLPSLTLGAVPGPVLRASGKGVIQKERASSGSGPRACLAELSGDLPSAAFSLPPRAVLSGLTKEAGSHTSRAHAASCPVPYGESRRPPCTGHKTQQPLPQAPTKGLGGPPCRGQGFTCHVSSKEPSGG